MPRPPLPFARAARPPVPPTFIAKGRILPSASAGSIASASRSGLLDRLRADYWRGRDPASIGGSPVDAAGMQLRSALGWHVALDTLQRNYPPDVARAAWVALLSEPESGWSVQNDAGEWVAYCVPGYDPLCGDDLTRTTRGASAPAGRPAVPTATVLPNPLPAKPWRVPDGLSACQRLLGLTAISDAGISDPALRTAIAGLVARSDTALARARIDDPNERTKARAKLVLAYMQARGYRTDPPGQNWWQPVGWTLTHGGTCEALSAATRAGMILAGVPVDMVWVDQEEMCRRRAADDPEHDCRNHATCVVWYDGGWQWADASVPAALGENPYVVAALDDAGTDARGDGLG